MEFTSLDTVPHYSDCEPVVSGLGYALVELRVFRTQGAVQVRAVIARAASAGNAEDAGQGGIGVEDCAKVHRVLLPRLEALLQSQDIYMEVTSPGTERNIKNAAEFVFFREKYVRVYDTAAGDWVSGRLLAADSQALTLEIDGAERVVPFAQISKAKLLNA